MFQRHLWRHAVNQKYKTTINTCGLSFTMFLPSFVSFGIFHNHLCVSNEPCGRKNTHFWPSCLEGSPKKKLGKSSPAWVYSKPAWNKITFQCWKLVFSFRLFLNWRSAADCCPDSSPPPSLLFSSVVYNVTSVRMQWKHPFCQQLRYHKLSEKSWNNTTCIIISCP